jgi:hypothetical protein
MERRASLSCSLFFQHDEFNHDTRYVNTPLNYFSLMIEWWNTRQEPGWRRTI